MPLMRRIAPLSLLVALVPGLVACQKRAPSTEQRTEASAPPRAGSTPPASRPRDVAVPATRDAAVPRAGRSWLYPSMQAGGDPSPSLSGPPRADPDGLEIKQLVMARKLDGRKPEGVTTEFSLDDGVIFCHLEAVNRQGPERKLTVKWFHEGTEFHRVTLTVGQGPIWRTWARHKLRKRHHGSWECTVQTESGLLVGAAKFTVKER